MRKKIVKWAWAPIEIPRSALVLKYIFFAYFGLVTIVAGAPIFSLTAPAGYAVIWGGCLMISGITGTIGAWRDTKPRERIEKWSVLVIASLMLAYAGSLNAVAYLSSDLGRQALSAGINIILIIPTVRFIWLARRSGKK